MPTLVFLLPFEFRNASMRESAIAARLGLTVTRTDDWDKQVGFVLIGKTGAVRLFQGERGGRGNNSTQYDLFGTADSTNEHDRYEVGMFFEKCWETVLSLNGRLIEERLIKPPGRVIET